MSDPNPAPGAELPRDDEYRREDAPPHIDESARRIGAAGKASFESAVDTGRALRRLLVSDLALARSAFGRAMAWVGVAIVFGASAWLLLMGAAIALLQALGWSWLASIGVCAVLSGAVAAIAAWRVSRFFDYTGLHATRRQLARLGIGDEDDIDDDEAAVPPPGGGA